MELQQVRYFVATAETLNISRAAERCGVAQPSLSQQVRALEEALGLRLFDRLGRGVALTDAGRAFLPRARRILAEVRDAEVNLRRELDHAGSVAVGAIPTMAPYLLPPALKQVLGTRGGGAMAGAGEEVALREALTGDLVEALLDNRIDVAITSTPLIHDHLDVEVIGHEELFVALPADHRLADRSAIAWRDLEEEATIALSEMHCLGQQIRGFCTAKGVGPRVSCSTTQLGTIFELVGLGLGISLVPEMAAAGRRGGRVRCVRLASHRPIRQIAAAWRKGRLRPRLGERLITVIREQIGQGRHRLG